MKEKEVKKEKTFYKKWWFWLIILATVIVIGITIIMTTALFLATEGIHKVAREVQEVDNEATVYTSAGENTIIVEIPNYTDDEKLTKKETIKKVLTKYANNDEGILSNYSKAVICTRINSDTNIEDYFLTTEVYELPSMTEKNELSDIYIDFVEYTKQSLKITSSNSNISEEQKGEDITLTAGKYTVGTDIKPGKYDAIAELNSGNFFVNGSTNVNEILSARNDGFGIPKYSNLTLKQGDTVEVRSSLSVKLQAK